MQLLKSLSQSKVSFLLAIYIGILLNSMVFYRRFNPLELGLGWISLFSVLTEMVAITSLTFFLMRLASLGGRLFFRVFATLLAIMSVAASYYMTFFNVVIGYGVVASVMTLDRTLAQEMISNHFIIWMLLVSTLPLLLIWYPPLKFTLLEKIKTPGQRLRSLLLLVVTSLLVWLPLKFMGYVHKEYAKKHNIEVPSYGGVVAHSYLPANWLTPLALFTYTQIHQIQNQTSLLNPTDQYQYVAPADIDDIYVVFIIGETTRWDHMGVLGYSRDTTPFLSREKNLVAFKGQSCDTATWLSLRCMFVREGGTADDPQRTLKEQNVFAVLRSLGFTSEAFSIQSDLWFYSLLNANSYSFRELLAAEKRDDNQPMRDMMLVNELWKSLTHYPKGKHLVVLHTIGSHYNYSQRYPRSFAYYQPECMGTDAFCSKAELINAYDNTVRYVDAFIKAVIDQVRNKKAIVFYAADHGESIDENAFFHSTPREVAPAEQFRVPILVWASDQYLQEPQHRTHFDRLRDQQRLDARKKQTQLFDSILGCLGYSSPDGGIVEKNNWCHLSPK